MANEKSDLADVKWPERKMGIAGSKMQFRMSVYGGNLRFGIVNEGDYKATVEFPVSLEKLDVLISELRRLEKAGPGTKHPVIFSKFDETTKGMKTEWGIVFVKDDKLTYSMDVHMGGAVHKVPIRGVYGVTTGSDQMQEAERSAYGQKFLVKFWESILPMAIVFSAKKREPGSFGNGGGNGGGGYRNNNNGGGNSGGGQQGGGSAPRRDEGAESGEYF